MMHDVLSCVEDEDNMLFKRRAKGLLEFQDRCELTLAVVPALPGWCWMRETPSRCGLIETSCLTHFFLFFLVILGWLSEVVGGFFVGTKLKAIPADFSH